MARSHAAGFEPIPARTSTFGPVTRRYALRALGLYGLFCAVGALPYLLGMSPRWVALGWGAWFPGAGFLTLGAIGLPLAALGLALFAVTIFLWFFMGNVLAAALLWIGTAALAAWFAPDATVSPLLWLAPALVVLHFGRRILAWRKQLRQDLALRREREAYLPHATMRLSAAAQARPEKSGRELTRVELASTRHLFNRALQPIDDWTGYDVIEQFQPAALRFQIHSALYALNLLHNAYLPGFHGYISQAQTALIDRYMTRPVWGYWVHERIWGRLSTNFDPAVRDNIMLTGFLSININAYMSTTGDFRYARPGSLPFRLNRRKVYLHDAHSLQDSVVRNFRASDFCLYPCEPNWIYSQCNMMGLTGLALYDKAFGTDHSDQISDRFHRQFDEEFMTWSGNVIPLRSSLTGGAVAGLVGILGMATQAWLMNTLRPQMGRSMWAMLREEFARITPRGLDLKLTGGDNRDLGNYRKGPGGTLATLLMAAREQGDNEIAEATLAKLDAECEPVETGGVLTYAGISNHFNNKAIFGRICRTDDWRELVTRRVADVATRPVLCSAAYPDVLVAKAVNDRERLDLVLYDGGREGRQPLGFGRLTPGSQYEAIVRREAGDTDTITLPASAEGRADCSVMLRGRTTVSLRRVA